MIHFGSASSKGAVEEFIEVTKQSNQKTEESNNIMIELTKSIHKFTANVFVLTGVLLFFGIVQSLILASQALKINLTFGLFVFFVVASFLLIVVLAVILWWVNKKK